MKFSEVAMLLICFATGVAVGGAAQSVHVIDSHRIIVDAQQGAKEWKRLFCETSDGRLSVVCQQPVIRPSFEPQVRPYRKLII